MHEDTAMLSYDKMTVAAFYVRSLVQYKATFGFSMPAFKSAVNITLPIKVSLLLHVACIALLMLQFLLKMLVVL